MKSVLIASVRCQFALTVRFLHCYKLLIGQQSETHVYLFQSETQVLFLLLDPWSQKWLTVLITWSWTQRTCKDKRLTDQTLCISSLLLVKEYSWWPSEHQRAHTHGGWEGLTALKSVFIIQIKKIKQWSTTDVKRWTPFSLLQVPASVGQIRNEMDVLEHLFHELFAVLVFIL